MPGGVLRYYAKTNSAVAHCTRHGGVVCRLTRTMNASRARGREGQGRPIGLLCAWLAAATDPDHDDVEGHRRMQPMPSHAERAEARATVSALPGMRRLLDLGRPRGDEEDEPVHVP